MNDVKDQWAAGTTYEEFMGRWSRDLAPRFLDWLRVPSSAHWLDVGCGTGSLTNAICNFASPASAVGCDPATPLISFAREHNRDSRQSFVVAGAGSLPKREGGYESVTSLLALNFFPDSEAAILEMKSLAAGGGKVSACVWDYGEGMEFLNHFWKEAAALDTSARELDEDGRFPICERNKLQNLFESAGLHEVRCESINLQTTFESFSDYWTPLLGGTGPAPSYLASLDEAGRDSLRRRLKELLQPDAQGKIVLKARAWAACGVAH